MYEEILKKMLTPLRLKHSYCVLAQAQHLAKIYGEDENKAQIAGLIHDITKEIISQEGVMLDEIQNNSPKLLHSISGSIYINKYLNINDEEIISAVRYHTTAKPDMTKLEKIIYLADFTSSDRDFDDAPYMRELVDKSLDEGMIYGLSYVIKELIDKKSQIHPDTFLAYNYYVKK